LSWDVTVVCPLTDSYVATAAPEADSAAEAAAAWKSVKYTEVEMNQYSSQSSLSCCDQLTCLVALSCLISVASFLLSLSECLNATLLHDSL